MELDPAGPAGSSSRVSTWERLCSSTAEPLWSDESHVCTNTKVPAVPPSAVCSGALIFQARFLPLQQEVGGKTGL